MGPKIVLDTMATTINSYACQDQTLECPAHAMVTKFTMLIRLPQPTDFKAKKPRTVAAPYNLHVKQLSDCSMLYLGK